MLFISSVTFAYAGLVHDARLYGMQAYNRAEGGRFQHDLFFRYGGQDQFSLFSILLAPLVSWIGLKATFFALYLVSTAVLFYALLKLLESLAIDDGLKKIVALVFAAAPLSYAAGGVLVIHEPFVTPRPWSIAAVMLAFAAMLKAKWLAATLLLGMAVVIHPLMAFGGCLIAIAYFAISWWPRWLIITSIVAFAASMSALALAPDLGTLLFGRMDSEWHEVVLAANPITFPLEWPKRDFVDLALSFSLLGWAGVARPSSAARRFYLAILAVGMACLILSIIASEWGYLLPFQGQAYRVLWVVKLMQILLGLAFARESLFGANPTPLKKSLGLAVIMFLILETSGLREWSLFMATFLLASVVLRGAQQNPKRSNWITEAVLWSMILGSLLWTADKLSAFMTVAGHSVIQEQGWQKMAQALPGLISPALWILALLALVAIAPRVLRTRSFLVGVFLAGNLLFFLPLSQGTATAARTRSTQQLKQFLDSQPKRQRPPVVAGEIELADCWFGAQVSCYFEMLQLGGAIFRRETALEGKRRGHLMRPFLIPLPLPYDLASIRNKQISRVEKTIYGGKLTDWEPTPEDLVNICQDPEVDYVILPFILPDYVSGIAGGWFIYDAPKVCDKAKVPRRTSR